MREGRGFFRLATLLVLLAVTLSGRIDTSATLYTGQIAGSVKGAGPENQGTLQVDSVAANIDVASTSASAIADAGAGGDWPMAAANPQRTSWTSEEVRGQLKPIWYRPIEPFINRKVQVIASNDTLYISTARGLYALSTVDLDGDGVGGEVKWIYPTELPLGHSPTVNNGIVYVGGYDRKIHAIEANVEPATLSLDPETGYHINDRVLWTFDKAEAGFETNPLVIGDTVYVGNRDGYMYALNAQTGALEWRYQTDGPILFSAAYKDNTIYFASNDSHAYALTADTGELVWKSAKLRGEGFPSYWPVVYQGYVIFGGSEHHSDDFHYTGIGVRSLSNELDRLGLYAGIPEGELIGPVGTEPGDWVAGTITIDDSRAAEYYENKPWRRRYFVLDRSTGDEYTFDSDSDGKAEYAPISFCWTHSGTRYPAVIGSDGVLYQHNSYISDPYIPRGGISGWKFGTQFISRVHQGNYGAVDEPLAYSGGGNLIYWSLTCDRQAGAYDITLPYGSPGRYWVYFYHNGLEDICPGLAGNCSIYGGTNGVYGTHGTVNPPIPYRGKVYTQNSNAIIAWGPTGDAAVRLPLAPVIGVQDTRPSISTAQLKQELAQEIEKMLAAGHLRPGYHSSSLNTDFHLNLPERNFLVHYFHNPGETLDTLVRALPHLSSELQNQTRQYLQQEFTNYGQYIHIGWAEGAQREIFDTPPEIQARMDGDTTTSAPSTSHFGMKPWDQVYRFYGLWQYAKVFGGAKEIFDNNTQRLSLPADNEEINLYPYAHNAYIAGYIGYLELEELAGYTESANVRAELDRLLNLRAINFTKGLSYEQGQSLNVAANFMYLVPELADYLHDHIYDKVKEAVDEYNEIAPGWFVSKYDATKDEGTLQVLFDYNAIFQAKALILREPREELIKYLDVPAFERGDLYYIQNLVAAIEAPHDLEKTASVHFGFQGDLITYTLSFSGAGDTLVLTDTLPSGVSSPVSFDSQGTSVVPTYDGGQHRLTWSDTPPAGQGVTIHYAVAINTSVPQALTNTAQLSEAGTKPSTATTTVIANPYWVYLPLIFRQN